jgi:hypothetical protein
MHYNVGKIKIKVSIRDQPFMKDHLIKNGRPRIEVDSNLLIQLREKEHLGWTRIAQRYKEITGYWVSRDTLKRRYREKRVYVGNGVFLQKDPRRCYYVVENHA